MSAAASFPTPPARAAQRGNGSPRGYARLFLPLIRDRSTSMVAASVPRRTPHIEQSSTQECTYRPGQISVDGVNTLLEQPPAPRIAFMRPVGRTKRDIRRASATDVHAFSGARATTASSVGSRACLQPAAATHPPENHAPARSGSSRTLSSDAAMTSAAAAHRA